MSKIIAINISEKKGTIKTPVAKAVFVENFGIETDAHAGKGTRQVSLLAAESIKKVTDRGVKGLCEGKFAENITTEGIILHTLPIGTKLKVGKDVVLRVTKIGKECHSGCEISKIVGQCIMPKEGIFCEVIVGGNAYPDDNLTIIEE